MPTPIKPSSGSQTNISLWPKWNDNKPFALALLLALSFFIVFLMVKTGQSLRLTAEIGKPEPFEHQITIDGQGKVMGTPDIATVSMGVETKGETVAGAQQQNSDTMNTLVNRLIATGIMEDDIQTANYNVYENNVYNTETEMYEESGWVVSQNVTVKVRDTSRISTVLDTAGKNGATNISGPNFTIDDPSVLKDAARGKAITDASEKAQALAKTLGVRLKKVVGYSEWSDSSYPTPYYDYVRSDMMGMGGGAPDVYAGSNEVTLNVSITYQLAD